MIEEIPKTKNLASRWGFILACNYILFIPISFRIMFHDFMILETQGIYTTIGVVLFTIFVLFGGVFSFGLSIMGFIESKRYRGQGRILSLISLMILILPILLSVYYHFIHDILKSLIL